jgi:hypothetical protein
MDVPSRQAFVVKVVPADERSAASGITNVIRSVGAAISPGLAQLCFNAGVETNADGTTSFNFLFSLPFILSGGVKILYDLLIWYSMKSVDIDAKPAPTPTTTTVSVTAPTTQAAGDKDMVNVALLDDVQGESDDADAVPAIVK